MLNRTMEWETEFWHYVSTGDGTSCPVYQACTVRMSAGVCGCPMYNIAAGRQQSCTLCYCPNGISCAEDRMSGPFCHSSNPGFLESLKPGRIYELLGLLSESWLQKGKVRNPPVPSTLISIMDRTCDIEVRTIPMKAYHGAIWKTREGWVVYLNSNDSPFKQRVTLFHEAFHVLAHCKATPIFKKRGSTKGAFNELLADNFALHILMPQKWFVKSLAACPDISILAEQYQVTEEAVKERIESLGL